MQYWPLLFTHHVPVFNRMQLSLRIEKGTQERGGLRRCKIVALPHRCLEPQTPLFTWCNTNIMFALTLFALTLLSEAVDIDRKTPVSRASFPSFAFGYSLKCSKLVIKSVSNIRLSLRNNFNYLKHIGVIL